MLWPGARARRTRSRRRTARSAPPSRPSDPTMEAASVKVGAPSQRRRSRGIPERRLAKLMVAPSMILIAVVAAWPIVYAIWLSLHEYSVKVAGLQRWAGPVGLRNYSKALSDPEWW